MPSLAEVRKPVVINRVETALRLPGVFVINTTNPDKLREYERILGMKVEGRSVETPELQSPDPRKVAIQKAIWAYELNGYEPVWIEDGGLIIPSVMRKYIPTFVKYWGGETEDTDRRDELVEELTAKGLSREATAYVYFAIYDGVEPHLRRGKTDGRIAMIRRGGNPFGYDDIFEPYGQPENQPFKTFAEMSGEEKDQSSHRNDGLLNVRDNPVELRHPVFQIPEPAEDELLRVDMEGLRNEKAIDFGFSLKTLESTDGPNSLGNYRPVHREANPYFRTYHSLKDNDPEHPVILTDVEEHEVNVHPDKVPELWQMDPLRRFLATYQRAEFFLANQREDVLNVVRYLETHPNAIPKRANKHFPAIEELLRHGLGTGTFRELGYERLSNDLELSRKKIRETGLFHKVGKHIRRPIMVGSMPSTSGHVDVLVTAAIGHMLVFAPRNGIFVDEKRQIDLIKEARYKIQSLELDPEIEQRALRNIGASIGSDPKKDIARAERIQKATDTKPFNIYTTNPGRGPVEVARVIKGGSFDPETELAVGLIADKKQAVKLRDALADILKGGHAQGRVCDSAKGGLDNDMQLMYDLATDPEFNDVSLVVEGGVGRHMGPPLIMGIDAISYNQQLVRAVIEEGDYFLRLGDNLVLGYPGTVSTSNRLVEQAFSGLTGDVITGLAGRILNVEGKPGYKKLETKANSMVFYINEFLEILALIFSNLGVENMVEFRRFVNTYPYDDLIKIASPSAQVQATPYRS